TAVAGVHSSARLRACQCPEALRCPRLPQAVSGAEALERVLTPAGPGLCGGARSGRRRPPARESRGPGWRYSWLDRDGAGLAATRSAQIGGGGAGGGGARARGRRGGGGGGGRRA